ncbi:MAG: cbb3-type cytochrome c oxidase subunit 3 [Rhodobacteraceae bacterium]|nr:cbb3-type cytochrome c oxidase subunit 3 [Paracoccaceae bacterium]
METYEAMRQFADSWALLAMIVFFIAVVLWVWFGPDASKHAEEAAQIPFEEKPVKQGAGTGTTEALDVRS